MQSITKRLELEISTPIDYLNHGDLSCERVYLLLHGFNERAKNAIRRWQGSLPANAAVLAPNGPYPLPEKKDNYWRVGHAWYFYDSFKQEYFTRPEAPAKMLSSLVDSLCPEAKITVIGFSQGAYLAPYLAWTLKNCDHIIAMNGLIRSDMVGPRKDIRYDVFNARHDPYVEFEKSKEHFDIFSQGHPNAFFHSFESSDHEVTPEHLHALTSIIR